MRRQFLSFSFLERYRDYGAFFIRLIVGAHLIYGTQDNVLSWARMLEFSDFLAARGVPFPLFSAHLSVYAQFVCGLLYLLGAITRSAALVMIINFIAALLIAHRDLAYQPMFPALVMLCGSLFLLFHGAGKLSVDDFLQKRE